MTTFPSLRPGDIVLTRGTSLLSRLIRRFTRGSSEPRTIYNHVGVIDSVLDDDAIIIESLSKVRRRSLRAAYGGGKTMIAIYRLDTLTDSERQLIADTAAQYVGRKYPWHHLIAHFLDWCLGGRHVFRRIAQMENYGVCSWLVAWSYDAVDVRFLGLPPAAVSPDDIGDHVTIRFWDWSCVRPLTTLEAES